MPPNHHRTTTEPPPNHHTTTRLKFLQVATVAASVLIYFDVVVIGICEEDSNAKLLEEYIVKKVKVDAGRIRVFGCNRLTVFSPKLSQAVPSCEALMFFATT